MVPLTVSVWFSETANANGTTVKGAAIAVSQHTTNLPINVTVEGGTLTGAKALYEVDLQDEITEGVTISVTNGKFAGEIGSENVTGFLAGGLYTVAPDAAYVVKGKSAVASGDADYPYTIGDAVAQIGTNRYTTLQSAVDAAGDGATIELLPAAAANGVIEGSGVVVPSGKNITIDFAGLTYKATGDLAGSTGTKNQAFQLLKDSTVTLKNGTITSDDARMLVQNYSNLTLENITLDGTKLVDSAGYVLSNNNGNTVIGAGTTINAKEGYFAFDVYNWDGAYDAGAHVTVNEGAAINGKIEVTSKGNAPVSELTINGGTFSSEISVQDCYAGTGQVAINGGTFAVRPPIDSDGTKDLVDYPTAMYPVQVDDVYQIKYTFESPDIEIIAENNQTAFPYTGEQITPSITVQVKGDTPSEFDLIKKAYAADSKYNPGDVIPAEQYTVTYGENIEAGVNAGSITITGVEGGDFDGTSTTGKFDITAAVIDSVTAEGFTFANAETEPALTVKAGEFTLTADDYTVTYAPDADVQPNNAKLGENSKPFNAGSYVATVVGKGSFSGTVAAKFVVAPASIDYAVVRPAVTNVSYTGEALTPGVKSVELNGTALQYNEDASLTDFTLSYNNNTNVGDATVIATGANNYTGSAHADFAIIKNDSEISVDPVPDQPYNGKAIEPALTVKQGGQTLNADEYDVTYADNTEAGTASFTVKLKGSRTGTFVGTFNITAAVAKIGEGDAAKYFATLPEAVEAAADGDTIELIADTTLASYLEIEKNLTIDLAGNTVDAAATTNAMLNPMGNVTLTIKDSGEGGKVSGPVPVWAEAGASVVLESGTLAGVGEGAVGIYGPEAKAITINGGTIKSDFGIIATDLETIDVNGGAIEAVSYALNVTGATAVTITDGDISASGESAFAIAMLGDNGSLTVNGGKITATAADAVAISDNGGNAKTDITIAGGEITSAKDIAIYKPAPGTLTITGGTITGATGIYQKSGTLSVPEGSTAAVNANGAAAEFSHSGNGALATGDAVVIESCDYPGGNPTASIAGGTFKSENAQAVATYATEGNTPAAQFISGGEFSNELPREYAAVGYVPSGKLADGMYTVVAPTLVEKPVATSFVYDGTEKTAVEAAEGYTVSGTATATEVGTYTATATLEDGYLWADNSYEDVTMEWTISQAVAKIGETNYATLDAAIDAVGEGETIELLTDIEQDWVTIEGGKHFTLNLGGNTLTGNVDLYDAGVIIANGTLAGTIYANGSATDEEYGYVTVAADATVSADYGIIVYQAEGTNLGYGQKVSVYGTVDGMVWVMGNITDLGNHPSTIYVNDGASITGDDVGIALNGAAVVSVDGGTVTGVGNTGTGIEVRAGKLEIIDGTIVGEGTATSASPNGNGTTTSGAGIAIAQHSTKLPVEVNVSGGTIKGATAVYESDPQGNDDAGNVSATLSGGEFISTS